MTTRKVHVLGIFALVAWLAGPVAAAAFSVSGKASTVIEWYENADEDPALPAYQYLFLNMRDAGVKGLNFRGYGRLAGDFMNEVDEDSELYYAYLEKRDLLEHLGFRLGRQVVATSAGFSVVDGLLLDLYDLGPLGVRAYGGGDVRLDEDYDAEDLTWGAEITGAFFSGGLDLGVSYLQKWDDSALTTELIGADINANYRNLFDVYGEWQFNYLSNATSYVLAGVKYHEFKQWSLRGEYLYSLPVFESTSIYSVFAVDEYQEAMGELVLHFDAGLSGFARYTHEIYESFSNANVFETGLEKIGTGRFSGYLVGTVRQDTDGQDLRGIKAHAAYFFTPKLQVGGGAHLDVLERDAEDDDDTTAKRFWLHGTTYITKKVNVEAKVERVESTVWDYSHRGRVRLNILF